MTMVEIVARAIADAMGEGLHYNSPGFMDAARAAISALREPTTKMLQAADDASPLTDERFCPPEHAWPAMIDAALGEKNV